MHTIIDKSNVYFLYDREKDTRERIGSVDDLVLFLADMMRKWYNKNPVLFGNYLHYDPFHQRNYKWSNHDINIAFRRKLPTVFNLQNLTGNDFYIISKTVVNSVFNEKTGEVEENYTCVYTRHLYPYTFYNGNGSVFDIREIIPEVKVCLINNFRKESKRDYKFWKYRRVKSHSTYYHGRHSTGWKSHKDRKQWMHNARNKKQLDQAASYRLWCKNISYDDRTIYDFEEDYMLYEGKEVMM